MIANKFINVVEKLNNEIYTVCDNLYEQGICFEYNTDGYVDIINFIGINVWNSEIDLSIETEEELENNIREKVLIITNGLCKWQHYDGF